MTPIDSAFIQTVFHARQLALAAQIVASGAVDIRREDGLEVSASILGSSDEPYEVRITLAKEGFSGSCDCPSAAQGPCKHQAALAFACSSSGLAKAACAKASSNPGAGIPQAAPAPSRLLSGLLRMDHQRLARLAESLCSNDPTSMAAAKSALACEAWPDPAAAAELRSVAASAGDPGEFETSLRWSRKARAVMAPILDKALSDPGFAAFGAELFLLCAETASAATDAPPDDSSGALCETASLFASHGARLLAASGAAPAAAAQAFADIACAGESGWACVSPAALFEHCGPAAAEALAAEILVRFNAGALDGYAAASVVEACASSISDLALLDQALALAGEPPERRAAKIHALLVDAGRLDEAFERASAFEAEGGFDARIFGFLSERLRAAGTPEKACSVDEALFRSTQSVEAYRLWMESASAAGAGPEAAEAAYAYLAEPDRLRRLPKTKAKSGAPIPTEGEARSKVNSLCRILVSEGRVEEALEFVERDAAGPNGSLSVALAAAALFPERAMAAYEAQIRAILAQGTTPAVYRKLDAALAAGCERFPYEAMAPACERLRAENPRKPNVLKAVKALGPALAESQARSIAASCAEPKAPRRGPL